LEFENHYIAAGNHVFRDSEALPEFRNIKTALRKFVVMSSKILREKRMTSAIACSFFDRPAALAAAL
jgi:hypothetical protein